MSILTAILGIILGILLGYYAKIIRNKLEEIKSILLREEEGGVAQTRSPLAKSIGKGRIVRPKSPKDIAKEQDIKFRNQHGI